MEHVQPVQYQMTFAVDGYAGRKQHINVIAADVMDGISTAIAFGEKTAILPIGKKSCDEMHKHSPRWMQSDAANCPDVISLAALRHYAERLGFVLISKES